MVIDQTDSTLLEDYLPKFHFEETKVAGDSKPKIENHEWRQLSISGAVTVSTTDDRNRVGSRPAIPSGEAEKKIHRDRLELLARKYSRKSASIEELSRLELLDSKIEILESDLFSEYFERLIELRKEINDSIKETNAISSKYLK